MNNCNCVTSLSVLATVIFALSIAVSGCKPDVGTRVHQWMDETKKQAKPEEVRAALIPFFSYEGDSRFQIPHVLVITNQLPKMIQSLPIFSANPSYIEVDCRNDRNQLDLTIGSGFGHWGIVVLRPGYTEDFSSHPEYIPWGDGVYFYDEYK